MSSWNAALLQNEMNCANNIPFGSFAEKEVNGLMEELFETVSNDPGVRIWDAKWVLLTTLNPFSPPRREDSGRGSLLTIRLVQK